MGSVTFRSEQALEAAVSSVAFFFCKTCFGSTGSQKSAIIPVSLRDPEVCHGLECISASLGVFSRAPIPKEHMPGTLTVTRVLEVAEG